MRCRPIAELQSPTARCPAPISAWLTMETGFAKSRSHAFGLLFASASAISIVGGTVRSAFAQPPGPTVSWPRTPWGSGIDSSFTRAADPPMRYCTRQASGPSSASSREVVSFSRPLQPALSSIRFARPPRISRRAGSRSIKTSSSRGVPSRPSPIPSMSSGV